MKQVTRVNLNAQDTAQLLLDSGLLGEINRVVLHPRGLALAIQVDEGDSNKAVGFSGMVVYQEEPYFDEDNLQEIKDKLAAWDTKHSPQGNPNPI